MPDREFLEELFASIDGVTFRGMFGGIGIFREGVMFAMVAEETLFLRADEQNRATFEAEGSRPFIYEGMARPHQTSYWRVPERLLDEPDEFRQWALTSLAGALAAKSAKPARKSRKPKVK